MATRKSALWRPIIIAACAICVVGTADLGAQPRALFQSGTPQGVDNRLNIARVPVIDGAGVVRYYDVTLTFTVDGSGKLALNPGATKIVASPSLAVGAFKAGIYKGGPGSCQHVVGTPGVVGGSRISGSIADDQNDCIIDNFLDFNASWVSGQITGHPNEAVLRAAGITFEGYSWGILGDVGLDWDNRGWKAGDIIGVVQSGQQLTIHNFGNDKTEDSSATFTLCSSCH